MSWGLSDIPSFFLFVISIRREEQKRTTMTVVRRAIRNLVMIKPGFRFLCGYRPGCGVCSLATSTYRVHAYMHAYILR